ncbi:19788_t:CDS:2, partial [Gigaspora margarita]
TNNSKDSKSSTTSLSKQAKKESTQFYTSFSKKKIKFIKQKLPTYQKEWEKQYSWLIYNEIQKKMVYATTSHLRFYNFRKSALDEHAISQQHNEANKKEVASLRIITVSNNAINNALQHVLQIMRIVFWLATENIALSKIESFLNLAQLLEVPNIKKDSHITYANYSLAHQILEAISKSISNNLWDELKASSAIGIIIDESTDIATESHIIIYVKYCLNRIVKIRYLQLLKLENGNAETIYNAIFSLF